MLNQLKKASVIMLIVCVILSLSLTAAAKSQLEHFSCEDSGNADIFFLSIRGMRYAVSGDDDVYNVHWIPDSAPFGFGVP
ncbi:MAG: hypothetical protein FWG31_04505 [Oscillospiraceae bacterium]|nr:hypothetical protein [Oscillospiraceae bacterium]